MNSALIAVLYFSYDRVLNSEHNAHPNLSVKQSWPAAERHFVTSTVVVSPHFNKMVNKKYHTVGTVP